MTEPMILVTGSAGKTSSAVVGALSRQTRILARSANERGELI